jgi:hypothetical protein
MEFKNCIVEDYNENGCVKQLIFFEYKDFAEWLEDFMLRRKIQCYQSGGGFLLDDFPVESVSYYGPFYNGKSCIRAYLTQEDLDIYKEKLDPELLKLGLDGFWKIIRAEVEDIWNKSKKGGVVVAETKGVE